MSLMNTVTNLRELTANLEHKVVSLEIQIRALSTALKKTERDFDEVRSVLSMLAESLVDLDLDPIQIEALMKAEEVLSDTGKGTTWKP